MRLPLTPIVRVRRRRFNPVRCSQRTSTKCAPRKDRRGVDLIADALPFGRLWYSAVSDAVDYAKFYSRSHDAVIRVYDDAGNVIHTHALSAFLLILMFFR